MPTYQQRPDGTWGPAPSLPWALGYDAEVTGQRWSLFDRDRLVASGTNRTRIGRALAMRRAIRRDRTRTADAA